MPGEKFGSTASERIREIAWFSQSKRCLGQRDTTETDAAVRSGCEIRPPEPFAGLQGTSCLGKTSTRFGKQGVSRKVDFRKKPPFFGVGEGNGHPPFFPRAEGLYWNNRKQQGWMAMGFANGSWASVFGAREKMCSAR